jgi:hypothetical protein
MVGAEGHRRQGGSSAQSDKLESWYSEECDSILNVRSIQSLSTHRLSTHLETAGRSHAGRIDIRSHVRSMVEADTSRIR